MKNRHLSSRGYQTVSTHRTGKILSTLILACCLGSILSVNTHAQVVSPQAYLDLQSWLTISFEGEGGATACACPEPYSGSMTFPSKYEGSGSSRDTLNTSAESQYREKTADIVAMQHQVSRLTDQIAKGIGGREEMDCLIHCLLSWTRNSNLLEATDNHTGKAVRKWTLAAVSSNLLKVWTILRDHGDPDDLNEISQWISDMADTVVADYSGSPLVKINNHYYWAAWSVAASSVLLDRNDLLVWSGEIYKTAMNQIDGSGYLPNELDRRTRAASYHNFALAPLVAIGVILQANGDNPFEENNQALARLAGRVVSSIDNPTLFEEVTGRKQKDASLTEKGRLAWLAMYNVIADLGPADLAEKCRIYLKNGYVLRSTALGGDLEFVFLK